MLHRLLPPPLSLISLYVSLGTSFSAAVPWLTSYQTRSAVSGASTETVSVPGYLAMVDAFNFLYFFNIFNIFLVQ